MRDTLFPGLQTGRGAVFSACRRYRYSLRRSWDPVKLTIVWIGLNPSTADEHIDDPTIRRCARFSRDWGYGEMIMLNLFGYRATQPKVMFAADDPVGPGNDDAIAEVTSRRGVGKIVAAWGAFAPQDRVNRVIKLIGRELHALGSTKDGRPRHPLYVPAKQVPLLYWRPDA